MTVQTVLPPLRAQLASTSIAVYAVPYDFRVDHVIPEGGTIAEMMDQAGIDSNTRAQAHCWIKDPCSGLETLIPRKYWGRVRPKVGMRLVLRITPRGGGGGGRKSGLGILLSVVVMVAAAAVTWGVGAWAGLAAAQGGLGLGAGAAGALGSLAGGLVGIAGKLAVNALIPPPSQNRAKFGGTGSSSGRAESKSYSITGTRNQLTPLGPVARVFGRTKITPVYGANPYTEIIGSEQYIRLLFCLGYGPILVDEATLKIGETPLDQYQGVQYVIHQNYQGSGLQLYTNDVDETGLAIEITNDGIRTPAVAAKGTLTFTGNADPADEVTIGSITYRFQSSLTATANRVKVGSTLVETMDNLVAAINGSGAAGTQYSPATRPHPDVTATAISTTAVRVTARIAGTAANGLATTDDSSNASWGSGGLTGGVAAVMIPTLPLTGEVPRRLEMTEDEKWVSQTTGPGADEVSFDLAFPEGLVRYQQDSNDPITHRLAIRVRFDVRYRLSGSSNDWTYLSVQPSGRLTCSAQPGNGETVTIGGKVYTFQTTLTGGNGNVWRGANLAAALSNLRAAINLGAGAGTAYSALTTEHPTVRATTLTSTQLTVEAKHLGHLTGSLGNNEIAVSDALSNGSWSVSSLRGGVDAFSANAAESFLRVGNRFSPVPDGEKQYEVQWRRLSKATVNEGAGVIGATTVRDKAVLTALRTIRHVNPVNMTGITLLEMRIKATAQLQQVIDTFNCIGTSMHPIPSWDEEAGEWVWSEPQATRYPPWHALEILRGAANPRPVPDAKIYLPDFIEWAEACAALDGNGNPRFLCDGSFDFVGTVGQALQDVAATGRAQVIPDPTSGMYVVVRDVPQDVPVQLVTPRNSSGYRARVVFTDPQPHGLKVEFQNEEKDYRADEVIAYAPGKNKDNADPNLIATINQPLIKRALQAYNSGLYNLAQVRLRPIEHSVTMDPEWVEMRKGRLVHLQHDAARIGQKSARIKELIYDEDEPDLLLAVVLDETVSMQAGEVYGFRRRIVNPDTGLTDLPLVACATIPGETNTLELEVPFDTSSAFFADEDTLLSFGIFDRATSEVIVKSILPGKRNSARIAFVDAARELDQIDNADQIPDYDPGTTPLPAPQDRKPQPPTIAAIRSDEEVMQINPDGSWHAIILVSFGALSGGSIPVDGFAARFRKSGTDAPWTPVPPREVNLGSIAISPVDEGSAYDIEVWSISVVGVKSDPVSIYGHTVIGKAALPLEPVNGRVEGSWFRWDYPAPPIDFAGFRVRLNPGGTFDWTGATLTPIGLVTENRFPLTDLVRGTYAVMVKAVDTGGRESASYTGSTLIIGAPVYQNVVETWDLSGDGFGGTIENGSVVSDVLTADLEGSAAYPSNPLAAAWPSDPEAAVWGDSAQEMTYTESRTPSADAVGSEMRIDAVITGAAWSLWYSTDGTTYHAWPGRITVAPATDYWIKLVTVGGVNPGEVEELQVHFEVPDETEHFDDIAIAATTGTRLALTKNYLGIRAVNPVIRYHVGETAVGIRIVDLDPTLGAGPLIECIDAAGAVVDGHIDADPIGPKDMNP